ncbi:MAG: thiol oxidoreductase [Alphaproteobacteria bacterium]|nr:thiol oxidoreductase [Alphaproteobacteria bacterium]
MIAPQRPERPHRRRPWWVDTTAVVALLFAVPTVAAELEILTPQPPFDQAERYETNSGGAGTFRGPMDRDAFSQPMTNISFGDRAEFNIGNSVFRRLWVTAPSSTKASDGLGPLFNSRACQSCHFRDGRGHPPEANFPDDVAESMLMRLSVPPRTEEQRALLASGRINALPDPVYGGQLQDLAIAGQQAEGRIHTTWTEEEVVLGDGTLVSLRRPAYRIDDPAFGPPDPELMISIRVATPMIGLGLLEAIPEEQILANADPGDADGDGISGRPNRVWSVEHDRLMLGRFGWKANEPTLAQQNAHAFAGDVGLSSPLAPAAWGDCTEAQPACRAAIHGDDDPDSPGVEVPQELMDPLLFYTQHLAVPARRDVEDPQVLRGRGLFYETGCEECHTSRFVTARDAATEPLSWQLVWPYSDLLLHDMGPGLADNRPDGQATGSEWRTAPLWGIGLTETVVGHTYYLHDGRARNLTEAILWHGGEAEAARDTFAAMPADDREALLAFLKSL